MIEENTFTVIDNDGNEMECFVLFTFESDVTRKSYVVYTDNTFDDKDRIQIYASTYIPDADGSVTTLHPINTAEEWELVEETLNNIQQQILGENLSEFDSNKDNDNEPDGETA